jgi:branched-chain amino acid transport system permease protein
MTIVTRARSFLVALLAPAVLLVAQAIVFPMPAGVYLQGVTLGLLGALVSVGMCLIYRSNRIINFAQSALGLVPAVIAVDLIVYSHRSFTVAALMGGALSIVLGLLVYVLVIKRFASSSRLILTVATIAVSQVCLGLSLSVPHLWGHDTRAEHIATGWTFSRTVGPLVFHAEHLLAWIVAPVALALVAVLLLRTRAGAAVRAAADRADRAATLGIPVDRLQMFVWAGAALLSFVGVFLRVAIVGLPFASTDSFTSLLTVLAALTVGRFTHLGRVALTAIALGVVEQAVTWNHPENPDLYAVVLAVVIFVGLALMAKPRTRLDRDSTSAWRVIDQPLALPARIARRIPMRIFRLLVFGALLAGAIDLPRHLDSGGQLKAATVVVFAIIGISLVVLTGWAGQVSLGQMGFVAVGAAVGPWITNTHRLDFSVGLIGAGVAGAIAALLVGLPALRLRGLYLAVITLAFNVATSIYLLKPSYAHWIPDGRIARPQFAGHFDLTSEESMYWLCLGVLVASYWVARSLRVGRPGRAMVAQRDNEIAAEGYGMSTTRTRLTAFSVSGATAAVAGCLLVHLLQSYPDQLLTPDHSITTFSATVVGGIASPLGAMLGAFAFVGSGWFLSDSTRVLSTSIGLLLVLMVSPSGIIGALTNARNFAFRRWLRPRRAATDDPIAAPLPSYTPPPLDDEVDAALRVRGLRVRIGEALIIDDVSFDVPAGSTLALLGTNGAGKSTVINAISGLRRVDAGTVEFAGRNITNKRAHRIAKAGVGQAPGGRGVFPSLTVAENLELAGWGHRRGDAGIKARTASALEAFPPLRARLREHAANLSGGEQQMLVLAMAWVAHPALLLIDELSLGLAPIVVEQLVDFLDRIRASGTTVVVVEQSLGAAQRITESAIFLERGRVAFAGRTSDLLDRPDLSRSIYLAGAGGGDVAVAAPAAARPMHVRTGSAPALVAHEVSVNYGGVNALLAVDLSVSRGEILGVIGANGAGKSTLLDALCGLLPVRPGRVDVAGRDVTSLSFARRARGGLGRSFQHAELFASLTVEETLAIACDRTVNAIGVADAVLRTPAQWKSEANVRRRVSELVEQFHLRGQRELRISELSTGQRRVVDLAAVVANRPAVVLLDEPSSGLAQPEVAALGTLLRRVRDDLDLTMVIVEHDIPLVSSLSDRLVVLDQGAVIASGAPADVLADPVVIASYLGTSVANASPLSGRLVETPGGD